MKEAAPSRSRLLAILAADAVGYSRLMSLDDRGTLAALDDARAVFRQKVAAHDGRVIDMAGDSVLAVFETATAAVNAALAIQRQLTDAMATVPEERRMRFRIGVHVGDVIEKTDTTVYGDGVNIAARLQSLAEPGGITVSQAVQGIVAQRVEARFDDIGEQVVKNITQPVRAFALRAQAAEAARRATVVQVSAAPSNGLKHRRRWLAAAAASALALLIGAAVGLEQLSPARGRCNGGRRRRSPPAVDRRSALRQSHRGRWPGVFRRRADRSADGRPVAYRRCLCHRLCHGAKLQGQGADRAAGRPGTRRALRVAGKRAAQR